MPKPGFILISVLVFAALNYGIYAKVRVIRNGDTVLLELAPVDPRSLMQGDYMRLRYALERKVRLSAAERNARRGELVLTTDENGIARFVRVHGGEALAPDERLLRYHRNNDTITIVPNSYLFQEGHASLYENAKYGVFKFSTSGERVLVGLADESYNLIMPEEHAVSEVSQ